MLRNLYIKWLNWRIKRLIAYRDFAYKDREYFFDLMEAELQTGNLHAAARWKSFAHLATRGHYKACKKLLKLEKIKQGTIK